MRTYKNEKIENIKYRRQIRLYGFVLFVLASIAGLVSYHISYIIQTREIDAGNLALLRQSVDQVDTQLRLLDNANLIFMLNNPSLTQFMSAEYAKTPNGRKYTVTQDLRNRLKDIKGTHPSVHTIFLLSARNGNALSEDGINTLSELSAMFDQPIEPLQSRNVSYLRSTMFRPSARSGGDGQSAVNVIALLRTYPAETRAVEYGTMATFISEAALFDAARQTLTHTEATLSIVSRYGMSAAVSRSGVSTPDSGALLDLVDGMLTEGLNAREDRQGRTYLALSPYTDWYYVLHTPKDAGIGITRTLRDIILVIITGYTLLVFGMSYLSNRRAYGSLDRLAHLLGRYVRDFSDKEDLVTIVEAIAESNVTAQAAVDHYRPMAVQMMLNDLLRPGRVTDFETHLDELAKHGVYLERAGFAVAVFVEADDGFGDALKGTLENGVRIAALKVDGRKTVAVFSFADSDARNNAERMRRTLEDLIVTRDRLCAGAGRVYPGGIGISSSYREALEAVKYRVFFSRNRALFIEDMRSELGFVSLGLDKSMQVIIGALKVGETRGMIQGIENYVRMIVDRGINLEMFLAVLSGTVVQALQVASDMGVDLDTLGRTELPNYPRALEECESTEAIIALTQEMFLLIARNIARKKNHRSLSQLGARAIQYVNERYADSEFSMIQLADLLGISDSYVRRIFREYATVSFQEYLTQVRMEQAKALLIDLDNPIHLIAQKVGYHSDNSFIRAFRNRYGLSPGMWRLRVEGK